MKTLQALLVAATVAASLGTARADDRGLAQSLAPAAVARRFAQAPGPLTPPPADPTAPAARSQAPKPEATYVDETPAYKKWWFWALSAAVVGGTAALGIWAVDAGSDPAKGCSAGARLCFGDGRSR